MQTHFLKFADEAEAATVLREFRGTQPVYEPQPTGEFTSYNVWSTPSGEVSVPEAYTQEKVANDVGCDVGEVSLVRVEQEPVLKSVYVGESEEMWLTYKDGMNLDVVGVIYKPTGNTITSEDGIRVPETAPLEGFHVNLLADTLPEELAQYVVTPANPLRVFA